MDEFRARRVRRVSERQGSKVHDTAEMDLINQNLCNKEYERKCKPCKNGFCYCFSSDSGDGGGGRTSAIRSNPRHPRHTELIPVRFISYIHIHDGLH